MLPLHTVNMDQDPDQDTYTYTYPETETEAESETERLRLANPAVLCSESWGSDVSGNPVDSLDVSVDVVGDHHPSSSSSTSASSSSTSSASSASSASSLLRLYRRSLKFVMDNLLLCCLSFAIVFGALVPAPGRFLATLPTQHVCIVVIFLVTGLNLSTSELKASLANWHVALFGIIMILFITPLLALVTIKLPLDPHEFSVSLAIWVLMPTTTTSGVLIVKEAQGDVTLSLALCVVTNLLAPLTVPLLLPQLVFQNLETSVSISSSKLLLQLSLTILLPILLGKIVRSQSARVKRMMKRQKTAAKVLVTVMLMFIPLMNVSTSVDQLKQISLLHLLLALVASFFLHIVLVIINGSGIVMMTSLAGSIFLRGVWVRVKTLCGSSGGSRSRRRVSLTETETETEADFEGSNYNHPSLELAPTTTTATISPDDSDVMKMKMSPQSSSEMEREMESDDAASSSASSSSWLNLEQNKALLIMCSQKSLSLALPLLGFLPEEVGVKGFLAIPMISAHFMQLLFDASLASWWKNRQDDGSFLGRAPIPTPPSPSPSSSS